MAVSLPQEKRRCTRFFVTEQAGMADLHAKDLGHPGVCGIAQGGDGMGLQSKLFAGDQALEACLVRDAEDCGARSHRPARHENPNRPRDSR
jgi:hypothetical protein